MKRYEVLDHTADIGLVVRGKDLRALFENAGEGFFDLITDLRRVEPRLQRAIQLRGETLERLMVDWLGELLYLHEVEQLLFSGFHVKSVGKDGLDSVVSGEPYREGVHVIKTGVKAVTYHQIQVKQGPDGWKARIIFDL